MVALKRIWHLHCMIQKSEETRKRHTNSHEQEADDMKKNWRGLCDRFSSSQTRKIGKVPENPAKVSATFLRLFLSRINACSFQFQVTSIVRNTESWRSSFRKLIFDFVVNHSFSQNDAQQEKQTKETNHDTIQRICGGKKHGRRCHVGDGSPSRQQPSSVRG